MSQLNFHTNNTPPHGFYTNLPVLQKITGAYKLWHAFYGHFPRLSKYSLGGKIDLLFTDVIEFILMAGYANYEQKTQFIVKAGTKLDLLKFFIQVAWEIKILDHKKYTALSSPINEIGKMIGGWLKQAQIKQPPSTK